MITVSNNAKQGGDILKVTGGMVLGSAGTIAYIAYKEYKKGGMLKEIVSKIDAIKEVIDNFRIFTDKEREVIWYTYNRDEYENMKALFPDNDEEYGDSVDEEVEDEV